MTTATLPRTDETTWTDEAPAPCEPCEHHQHAERHPGDEPAAWLVWWLCPGCERVATLRLCEPGRRIMQAAATVGCVLGSCGYTSTWDDYVLTIRPIGGAA